MYVLAMRNGQIAESFFLIRQPVPKTFMTLNPSQSGLILRGFDEIIT